MLVVTDPARMLASAETMVELILTLVKYLLGLAFGEDDCADCLQSMKNYWSRLQKIAAGPGR